MTVDTTHTLLTYYAKCFIIALISMLPHFTLKCHQQSMYLKYQQSHGYLIVRFVVPAAGSAQQPVQPGEQLHRGRRRVVRLAHLHLHDCSAPSRVRGVTPLHPGHHLHRQPCQGASVNHPNFDTLSKGR